MLCQKPIVICGNPCLLARIESKIFCILSKSRIGAANHILRGQSRDSRPSFLFLIWLPFMCTVFSIALAPAISNNSPVSRSNVRSERIEVTRKNEASSSLLLLFICETTLVDCHLPLLNIESNGICQSRKSVLLIFIRLYLPHRYTLGWLGLVPNVGYSHGCWLLSA